MIRFCLKLSLVLSLVVGCTKNTNNPSLYKNSTTIDQINELLQQVGDTSLNDSIRFGSATKANKLARDNALDSLASKSLLELVKLSYPLKTKDSFLYYYPKSFAFSKKVGDTITIAQTHNYAAFFYLKYNNIIDSAYYHFYQGSKYFKLLKDDYQSGKMLLNMAIIQKNKRDYAGSEEVTQEALQYLRKAGNKRFLASAYNNLGIVNNELKKLSVAITYHQKALGIRRALKSDSILIVESINNIAVAYKDNGDYSNAFAYFDSVRPFRKLLEKHPVVRARTIDNVAHLRLLSGNIGKVLEDMNEALSIREYENHLTGMMVSFLHLSEYYRFINDAEKSFDYAMQAKNLSQKHQNYRDVLKALRILSLNTSAKNNNDFIAEYYATLDQVEKTENSVADKFARIRFEVDQKEEENKRAAREIKEKNNTIKNQYIFIGSLTIIIILIIVILYLIRRSYKYKRRSYRYKKELYKEFNHRTKQNLIATQSGLSKVKNNIGNNIYLQELETIIQSLLLLQSLIEKSNYSTHIDLGEYLRVLVNSLVLIYPDYKVNCTIDPVPVNITTKKASLIARIIAEFITNAFKHGFSENEENTIEVSFKRINNTKIYTLSFLVSGKEWDPEAAKGKGDGLQVMNSLARKIPSHIDIEYKNGKTTLQLKFKID